MSVYISATYNYTHMLHINRNVHISHFHIYLLLSIHIHLPPLKKEDYTKQVGWKNCHGKYAVYSAIYMNPVKLKKQKEWKHSEHEAVEFKLKKTASGGSIDKDSQP